MGRILVFGFVCLVGLVAVLGLEGCVWDSNTELNQGLDPVSLDAGAKYIAHLSGSSVESCQQACCDQEECELAVTGTLFNGTSVCALVKCTNEGKDVCVLVPSDMFNVYRKAPESTPEADVFDDRVVNATDRCRYTSSVGPCRAAFPRFYYNVVNQTCEMFLYGGCSGNTNNFISQTDCEAACGGVTGDVIPDLEASQKKPRMAGPQDVKAVSREDVLLEMTVDEFAEKCEAAAKPGLCRASIPRYYYDSGSCKRFIYGGCGGNQNNYDTKEACMAACTVKIVEKKDDEAEDIQEACGALPDPGPCRAAFPKFYFERSTGLCQMFIYGGCKGNANLYNTKEECLLKCAGRDGSSFEAGKMHTHWTPAIFLMVTLAIISILLLVGMILIALRRTKHQQLFILDDRRELLPEEQLPEEDPPKATLH